MTEMQIASAQYTFNPITCTNSSIRTTIDGQELFVPIEPGNRHYAEIMRQVDAGALTIKEAV